MRHFSLCGALTLGCHFAPRAWPLQARYAIEHLNRALILYYGEKQFLILRECFGKICERLVAYNMVRNFVLL